MYVCMHIDCSVHGLKKTNACNICPALIIELYLACIIVIMQARVTVRSKPTCVFQQWVIQLVKGGYGCFYCRCYISLKGSAIKCVSGTMSDSDVSVEIPTPNSWDFRWWRAHNRLAKWLRQRSTTRNCKFGAQNVCIAISGCRLLSQSPWVSFLELGVVENLSFAVGTVMI